MALSRPLYSFLGFYFEQAFNHPVRTASVKGAITASLGCLAAQKIKGLRTLHMPSIYAYLFYGFCFGETVPYYFNEFIIKNIPSGQLKFVLKFLAERTLLAPLIIGLYLYFMPIFENHSHEEAMNIVSKLFKKLLKDNLSYLSLPIFLNLSLKAPILNLIIATAIKIGWIVYMDKKVREQYKKTASKEF